MGVDYYKILQLDRSAKDDDIKNAYRKLAKKWHPDKNPNDKKVAEAKFKKISEAYDVLSNPQKRALYDQYGEGLIGQVPPSHAGGFSRGSMAFQFNRADDMISELLRSSGPFSGMGGMGGRTGWSPFQQGVFGDNVFASFWSIEGEHGSWNMPRKGEAVERKVACTLEDLYKGTTRKLKILRDVEDATG